MEIQRNSSRPPSISDIFLRAMEQISNDENQKAYVRKMKTLMDVPEFVEFMNWWGINTMGCPIPIAAVTVDKAVDCLCHFFEDNIEGNHFLTREQKTIQKGHMTKFMNGYCEAVKNFIHLQNLLTQ